MKEIIVMTWKYFCRITTVGMRNKEDVIKSLTPMDLAVLKHSVFKNLDENNPERAEMINLINMQLQKLMAHHG